MSLRALLGLPLGAHVWAATQHGGAQLFSSTSLQQLPGGWRRLATRAELLERLKQAKSQELLHNPPVTKSLWEDRRTYMLLAGLLAASGWAYSLLSGHSITNTVYMDISIDGQPAGRVVMGLHGNTLPRTTLNFLELATHKCGYGYRGSSFYEVIPRFAIRGGDITKDDGTGGVSALGPSFYKEKSPIKHGRGTLSMVADAEGAVRSQFFICCSAAPALNTQMVAFGKVLEGMELVDRICQMPTDEEKKPTSSVRIAGCGELVAFPVDDQSNVLGLVRHWLSGSSSSSSSGSTASK